MASHNDLGKWGEDKAEEYLRRKGYEILERDWRYGHNDIDIIAVADDKTLVFVEVKTRALDDLSTPEDAVDRKKIRNIQRAASAYVKLHGLDNRLRFDVVAVRGKNDKEMEINHIVEAFTPIPYIR